MADETLFADGFDEAIVGIDYISYPPRIIYDKNKTSKNSLTDLIISERHRK